jgi:predicted phosphohydrolase
MKIREFSDIHLSPWNPFIYEDQGEDVVVIAGDLCEGYLAAMDWFKQIRDKPILYVPGNHEYYGYDYFKLEREYNKITASKYNNVYILNNKVAIIDDVAFVGTTLWTDFNVFGNAPNHELAVRRALNDFVYINMYGKTFTVENQKLLNVEAIDFLDNLEYIKSISKKMVLITHHGSEWSIAPRYKHDPVTAGFATKVPMRILNNFDIWFHGHMHDPTRFTLNNEKQTKIICNPKGYNLEHSGFDENLIVEI